MKREIISVIDADGTELDVDLISLLEKDGKNYLIYSKGEKQKNGNLIIYITKVRIKDGEYYLDNITDEEEWKSVKSFLSKTISK